MKAGNCATGNGDKEKRKNRSDIARQTAQGGHLQLRSGDDDSDNRKNHHCQEKETIEKIARLQEQANRCNSGDKDIDENDVDPGFVGQNKICSPKNAGEYGQQQEEQAERQNNGEACPAAQKPAVEKGNENKEAGSEAGSRIGSKCARDNIGKNGDNEDKRGKGKQEKQPSAISADRFSMTTPIDWPSWRSDTIKAARS
jgi:hypothetical protein